MQIQVSDQAEELEYIRNQYKAYCFTTDYSKSDSFFLVQIAALNVVVKELRLQLEHLQKENK